jgi:hypothetical protein
MKQLLPLALFGAILLAGCDTTTTQASTSSETQTSLQELANRLVGLPSNGVATSARKVQTPVSVDWSGIPDTINSIDYTFHHLDDGSYNSSIQEDLRYNRLTSDSTWEAQVIFTLMDTFRVSTSVSRSKSKVCTDRRPAVCGIGNGPRTSFGELTFRNGCRVVTDSNISGSSPHYFVDQRWYLTPRSGSGTISYDVSEKGIKIGYVDLGNSLPPGSAVVETAISTAIVRDLNGKQIIPQRSSSPPLVLPTDTLGLRVQSATSDSSGKSIHLDLTWSFLPHPLLKPGVSVDLKLEFHHLLEIYASDSFAIDTLSRTIILADRVGSLSLDIPIPTLGVNAKRVDLSIKMSQGDGLSAEPGSNVYSFGAYATSPITSTSPGSP